ncbi:MAG: tetratricopeptide repeat protein, partial [Bdellovibrionales bacterium]|nr:tetratricopeptide repeat protein [Bdellovibrionales bacterium]
MFKFSSIKVNYLRLTNSSILILSACLLFVSCSNNNSLVAKRVDLLDRDLENIRNFQAEQTTEIASLRRELNMLRGNLEELQYKSQPRASASFNTPESPEIPAPEIPGSKPGFKITTPPPAIVPHEFVAKDIQLSTTIPGNNGELLRKAIEEIKVGSFSTATSKLEELRDLSYGVDWGAVVLFWLGVSAEGELQNSKAISYYHELVSSYPKHERTSTAMLRQGSVLIRERDPETARLIFQKL